MKLTNAIRTEIINKCIKATFTEREARYEQARTILADELYNHAFGADELIAKRLPAYWLSTMSTVRISRDGFSTWGRPGDTDPRLKLSKERLQPEHIGAEFNVTDDHPLATKADAIIAEHQAIEAAKTELESKLVSLVYSVPTIEKLKEVWPEGEPFFPAIAPKQALPIPYDLTLQINSMMGIKAAAK